MTTENTRPEMHDRLRHRVPTRSCDIEARWREWAGSLRSDEREKKERETIRQTRLGELAHQLGQRYWPTAVSFDTYQVQHKGQQQILDRVKGIAARLSESITAGQNVIWYGTPGTGKDHMMSCLLYRAIDAEKMVEWHRGLSWLSDRGKDRGESVLAISDPIPPASDCRDKVIDHFFEIVDTRYRKRLPIWLTLNARNEQDIEAKLSAQLFDRLRDGAHLLPCYWPSFRAPFERRQGG